MAFSLVDFVKLIVLVKMADMDGMDDMDGVDNMDDVDSIDDMDEMVNRYRSRVSKCKEKRKVLEEQALSHLFIRNIDYLIDNIQSSKENIQTVLDQIANSMNKDSNYTDLRSLNSKKFAKALGLVYSYKVTDNQILSPADGKSTNENTKNTFPVKNTEDLSDPFWFCGRPCGQLDAVKESETPKRNE